VNGRPRDLGELRRQHREWRFRRDGGRIIGWKPGTQCLLIEDSPGEMSLAVDLAEAAARLP
jgi:hypothetical protein